MMYVWWYIYGQIPSYQSSYTYRCWQRGWSFLVLLVCSCIGGAGVLSPPKHTYIYDDNLHGLHCSNVLGNYQRYSKTVFCILFMTYWRWFCAKNFFRKNFIWRHNDVIKNVYFLMKCPVKSVKHAFLTM